MKSNDIIEKRVVKRGRKWCVLHGRDSPKAGKNIKCYTGKDAEAKAKRMHRAIMWSKYKDLDDMDLLEYTRFAMLYESEDIIIKCFKEIAARKQNEKLNWYLKTKKLPEIVYNVWKRIRVKLGNREVALIVLKPTDYERLKEHLTFNYKIKELPEKLKSIILKIHNMSDDKLLELKKQLDE